MSKRYQAGFVRPGYDPLKVPNAPTIGTVTLSSTTASVPFTAPSCVGGAAITGYTAVSTPGCKVGTGSSSPISVASLCVGTAYTFRVYATNSYGPSAYSASSNSVTPVAAGQQAYTTAGTYSWVAPAGVTSVSVVAVGGGGSGRARNQVCFIFHAGSGGGGGGLGYTNNISVTPGASYTVVVGAGGVGAIPIGTSGGVSYFNTQCVVKGAGGGAGSIATCSGTTGGAGGSYTGTGGGTGGAGGSVIGYGNTSSGAGGGGAGGYGGVGGKGGDVRSSHACATGGNGVCGGGGGGFGMGSNGGPSGSGGGVGILGRGSNGVGATSKCSPQGGGGSGGSNGSCSAGGAYGGGGRGATANSCVAGANGGVGAVRIIWPGTTRSFPSTNTGDL